MSFTPKAVARTSSLRFRRNFAQESGASAAAMLLVSLALAGCSQGPAESVEPASPAESSATRLTEGYRPVPMPPGFHVEASEIDGPVFADSRGHTLYKWPFTGLRNGYSGERKGIPACYDKVLTKTAGLMSPYPAGLLLPELDTRPSCTDLWPPVVAPADAEPVGKWTILERKDGTRQWAYDEHPLYTSIRDHEPGDVIGGTTREPGGDGPAVRVPVAPPPSIPAGFAIKTSALGRLLTTDEGFSVYSYDKDTAEKTMCDSVCTRTWEPLLAPQTAQAEGDWSIMERAPGVRQWTYRQQPLYAYAPDERSNRTSSLEGSDVDGWRNVYTQQAPPPPSSFTVQDSIAGKVLADSRGMTIYTYHCGDDSQDQLSCDHPEDTQVYRISMCGGSAEKCLESWPYVIAENGVEGSSLTWSVIQIDPKTGHLAEPGDADSLRVWAYRDRPVYTYSGDKRPGDVNGAGNGEWRGMRNGYQAFWLRDDFFNGTL